MGRYLAFGLTIDSGIPLPELPEFSGEPDVDIRLAPVPRVVRRANLEEHYLFPEGVGRFLVKAGREILVDPLPGADYGQVRAVLMGRVMAVLLRQRGWLPLHGSAVAIGGKGVIFAGPSGSGKSTTAAAFHARGWMVIADDLAAVRVVGRDCEVLPAWSHLRLLDDSRRVLGGIDIAPAGFQLDKHRFDLTRGILRDSFPLKRIFVLGYGDEVRSEIIPALSAVSVLSDNSTSGRWMEPDLVARHLESCTAVCSAMTVHRLIRPLALDDLPRLVSLVEDDLAANP